MPSVVVRSIDRQAVGDAVRAFAARLRRHHPEVDRRFVESNPACDVDEDVLGEERQPHLLLQDRHQKRYPIVVDAHGSSSRGAEGGAGNQRLQLHQDRPASFEGGNDRAAGGPFGALCKEKF